MQFGVLGRTTSCLRPKTILGRASVVMASLLLMIAGQIAPAPAAAKSPRSVADYVGEKRIESEGEQPRVVGGEYADEGEWPWQVAIISTQRFKEAMADSDQKVRNQAQYRAMFCGGSFISPEWILTAAHCVVDMYDDGTFEAWRPDAIEVLVGTNDLTQGERIAASRIVVHDGYVPTTNDNDIALVKLAAPAFEGDGTATMRTVMPATLELEKQLATTGAAATVTGWGLTESESIPVKLLEAEIKIQENATCNANIVEDRKPAIRYYLNEISKYANVPSETLQNVFSVLVKKAKGPITENMICAGLVSGAKDACNGDSGGPLVIKGSDGTYIQVGVVSWGAFPVSPENDDGRKVRCGYPQFFGYYTRVSKYTDWLKEHMSE